jgi:hypothetical protein
MLVPKPAFAKARQTSARHDHVHVGMMREGGAPSMENRMMPMRAPRCLGSAAMASVVSADAFISKS